MDITALHTTVSPQTGGDSDGNVNAKEEEKQTASASLLSILPWQRENLARRKTASPEQDFWKIEDEMFFFSWTWARACLSAVFLEHSMLVKFTYLLTTFRACTEDGDAILKECVFTLLHSEVYCDRLCRVFAELSSYCPKAVEL